MPPNTPMWRRYLTFWGRDLDRDLRDEIEFHIDARARELMNAGWTEGAARDEAARAFGDAAQVRSECRRIDTRVERGRRLAQYVEDVRQDVQFALRQFRRQPGFWAVVVVTLVVGIASSTSVFTIVDAVLFKPLPYTEPHRLVHVLSGTWKGVFVNLRDRSRTMRVGAYSPGPEVTLQRSGDPIRVQAATVSPELFDVLGVQPELGRVFTPDESDPRSPAAAGGDGWRTYGAAMLSEAAWRTHFAADPDTIGRTITISGVPHTVIGVMPATFGFPSRETAVWLPMSIDRVTPFSLWGPNALTLVARVREGYDLVAARRETRVLIPTFRDLFPFYLTMPGEYGADAPVRPLHEQVVGDVRTELLVLLAAIGVVLLTVCLNVANLLLARGINRDRELVTRAALGAGRGRLIRQMLSENVAVAVLAGVVGTLLSLATLQLVVALLPLDLPRSDAIRIDTRVLLFAVSVSIVTGLTVGLLPALRTTRHGASLLTRGAGGVGDRRESRLTSIVAACQFACAVVLVVSATLLLRSFWNLTSVNPGFDPEGLVSARIAPPGSPGRLMDDLVQRLDALPAVHATAVATGVPFGNDTTYVGFGIEARAAGGGVPTVADVGVAVTAGFFQTMAIPLLEGRAFGASDGPSGERVVMVSRSLARKYWGADSPLGSRVRLPEKDAPWRTVVGVVGDVKWSDLAAEDPGVLYLPLPQHDMFTNLRRIVIRTTADTSVVAANVRGIVRALDPEAAVSDIRTAAIRMGDTVARPKVAAYLLGGFAAIALFLAAIGVYGVLSYAMNRRAPEIGVRIALGASHREVVGSLCLRGVHLTLIGIAIGVVAALGATQFLSNLLFGVDPVEPVVFGAVVIGLLLIGLAVSYVPARRAGRIDPVIALRQN